jgi:FAD/FMN-containing dehydrogenase
MPGVMRIVGSGHSFSDILDTEGKLFYRSKRRIKNIVKDPEWLKPGLPETLMEISGNATLNEINKALKKKGLAFINLGSAVSQTYAGAISTSTHGTGIDNPPLCDDVRSLLMITPAYGLTRIEPTDGISDPERFTSPDIKLIQSDKIFNSALVSMGCMGIILSITSRVTKRFKLEEKRTMLPWETLRDELKKNPGKYLDNQFFDILINPYPVKGQVHCVITERKAVPVQTPNTNYVGWFLRWLIGQLQNTIARILAGWPKLIPKFLHLSLKSLIRKDTYIDESTEIFDLDLINRIRAVSAEYIFPCNSVYYLDAVEALINTVINNKEKGLFQNCPFGVRYTAPSRAYMSMMHGNDCFCTVETPLLSETDGWRAILNSYEAVCMQYGGRPHWGQYHALTGQSGWIRESYSKSGEWMSVLHELDPTGTFRNNFTRRIGIIY